MRSRASQPPRGGSASAAASAAYAWSVTARLFFSRVAVPAAALSWSVKLLSSSPSSACESRFDSSVAVATFCASCAWRSCSTAWVVTYAPAPRMTSSGPATRATSFRRIGQAVRPRRRLMDPPEPATASPGAVIPCRGTRPSLPPLSRGSCMWSSCDHPVPGRPRRFGRPRGQPYDRDRRSAVETTRSCQLVERTAMRTSCQARGIADCARDFTVSDITSSRSGHGRREHPVDGGSAEALDGVTVLAPPRCVGLVPSVPGRSGVHRRTLLRPGTSGDSRVISRSTIRNTSRTREASVATSKAPARRRLVIVESPTKARTIAGYLGPEFEVEASRGHIRDLPQPSELPADMKKGPFGKFAVDVDNGFEAYYVVDADKKKMVGELKRALKDADELYLATDEDREGEAIAWHLLEVLQPKVPVRRMVFHEITREAIQRALQDTRDLDERLVDAQETRRILDRLYGYEVSPVLWRKVRAGLSAGRVQSVATRLVVERERERMAFRSASYWDVLGTFAKNGDANDFPARLVAVEGARVAVGRDFDDRGVLTASARSAAVLHLDQAGATALADGLAGAEFAVRSLEEKPYTRRPAAPFTTSTLQQEASRKLRFSSRQTMRVAQTLYENGYITYMRTDSTNLSEQAVTAARRQAAELYGPEFVPDRPRVYASKTKNAQEAHEAIRPSGDAFRTPAQVSGQLRGDEFRLYELIWKRTVASQMADARGSTATVRLGATAADGRACEFSASGTVITFRGFLAAYEEGRDDDRSGSDDEQRRLPVMAAGDPLDARELHADGHETTPTPRFTEASLIKALEE